MILSLDSVLTPAELDSVRASLQAADFVDGKTTAGWHTRLVKHNSQLQTNTTDGQTLIELVRTALWRHPLFQVAAHPQTIHTILFSRYETGMFYGTHVDNAIMGKQRKYRSDLSLTLFLSDPSRYDGGELIIQHPESEQPFKLSAGSAVLYPSTTLHRVDPVTSGIRLVAVAWVQSIIRDPLQREILMDLDTVRRSIFHKDGKTSEFDLIAKSYANLLRQWAEV